MTTVECIIFSGKRRHYFLRPTRKDFAWEKYRKHGRGGEARQTARSRRCGNTRGLVPSDLALMRFNTRTIITRYRYNAAASRHSLAPARNRSCPRVGVYVSSICMRICSCRWMVDTYVCVHVDEDVCVCTRASASRRAHYQRRTSLRCRRIIMCRDYDCS